MTARVFVDTNVLVYFRDATVADKQARAAEWLSLLWTARTGRLSFQVLNEYYVTVTGKLRPGMRADAARADVLALFAWKPVATDRELLLRGWSVQTEYGLSWWDALIVAAAQIAGCPLLLSEDMQDGRDVGGVRIVDPFRHTPSDVCPR